MLEKSHDDLSFDSTGFLIAEVIIPKVPVTFHRLDYYNRVCHLPDAFYQMMSKYHLHIHLRVPP